MSNQIEQSVRRHVSAMMGSGSEAITSVHFDSISGDLVAMKGLDLAVMASRVLREANACLSELPGVIAKKPLIFLPLGCSEELRLWDSAMWAHVGSDDEPPSLYLTSLELFEVSVEEYRRPVESPSDESSIEALYRSFRSAAYMTKGWEFTNGIYLFLRGAF